MATSALLRDGTILSDRYYSVKQIGKNEGNEVVAVDSGGGLSAIRLWDVSNPGSFSSRRLG